MPRTSAGEAGRGSGSLNSRALQASCLVARLLQGLPLGDMHQHGVQNTLAAFWIKNREARGAWRAPYEGRNQQVVPRFFPNRAVPPTQLVSLAPREFWQSQLARLCPSRTCPSAPLTLRATSLSGLVLGIVGRSAALLTAVCRFQ